MPAAVAVVLTLAAAPALAHVEAEAEAGPTATVVTFSFTHGCEEEPTTSLRIQIPDNVAEVTPTDPEGWTSSVTDSVLEWNGGSIPNGTKGEFSASMVITGAEGDVVFFPTVQGCATAENDWLDKSEDAEAEQAAPRITLTAEMATAGASSTTTGSITTTTEATTTTTGATTTSTSAPSTSDDSSSSTAVIVVIAIVVALVVVAGVAFAMRGRDGGDGGTSDADAGDGGTDS